MGQRPALGTALLAADPTEPLKLGKDRWIELPSGVYPALLVFGEILEQESWDSVLIHRCRGIRCQR
jgi:hypothetical protein